MRGYVTYLEFRFRSRHFPFSHWQCNDELQYNCSLVTPINVKDYHWGGFLEGLGSPVFRHGFVTWYL